MHDANMTKTLRKHNENISKNYEKCTLYGSIRDDIGVVEKLAVSAPQRHQYRHERHHIRDIGGAILI